MWGIKINLPNSEFHGMWITEQFGVEDYIVRFASMDAAETYRASMMFNNNFIVEKIPDEVTDSIENR